MTVHHAVQEEGVVLREIAETLGNGLMIPVVSIPPEKVAVNTLGGFMGWICRHRVCGRKTAGSRPGQG